jgi:hypothetical protein
MTMAISTSWRAIAQRCTQAARTLQPLLKAVLANPSKASPGAVALVARFGIVAILDGTTISLPIELSDV